MASPFATSSSKSTKGSYGKDIVIVIVDDDLAIRDVVSKAFESTGFHNVCWARMGLCLSILAKRRDSIHIVVIDEVMSQTCPIETLEYLAQIHPYIVGILYVSGLISRANYGAKAGKVVSGNIISVEFLPERVKIGFYSSRKCEEAEDLLIEQRKPFARAYGSELRSRVSKTRSMGSIPHQREAGPGFSQDLGLELIKIIVIGVAVILLLSSGIDDLIRRWLSNK